MPSSQLNLRDGLLPFKFTNSISIYFIMNINVDPKSSPTALHKKILWIFGIIFLFLLLLAFDEIRYILEIDQSPTLNSITNILIGILGSLGYFLLCRLQRRLDHYSKQEN